MPDWQISFIYLFVCLFIIIIIILQKNDSGCNNRFNNTASGEVISGHPGSIEVQSPHSSSQYKNSLDALFPVH